MIFDALNDNVVIVELSNEEMKKYSVTYDTLSCDDPESEAAVGKILAKAREMRGEKTGSCENVTVEALPAEDGGCFFIFTFREKKKRYRVKKPDGSLLLETESIDGILDFSSAVKGSLNGKSRLFRLGGKYYMCVSNPPQSVVRAMGEFGAVRRCDGLHISRLSEYGQYIGKI